MKIKFTFCAMISFLGSINAQIYTPSGTIQGTSSNNFIGIGTNTPSNILTVQGNHNNSRILLHSTGGGYDTNQADLVLWSSEPGLTYTGVGIGNNISNYTNIYGLLKLLNPVRGGSYLRLLDNALSLNVVSNSGVDKQALHINSDGNVGVDILNASHKLEINGNSFSHGAFISSISDNIGGQIVLKNPSKTSPGSANGWNIYNMGGGYGNSLQFWAYDNLGCTDGGLCANRFTIMDNGNVGIGTVNPTSKLESVSTSAGLTPFKTIGTNGYLIVDNVGSGENYFSANKFHEFQINGSSKVRIDLNGNMGIGINNPQNKLDVNGTIHSQEVKVDMTGWSDFVFKKDYSLPTLEQVEKHIAEKGHLENIPSEKEVLENGINMGEMNAKLLQKIEELTLYVIEQNKRLVKVELENAELKGEIKKSKK